MVDFGNVCIGQCEKLELTLKSITDVPLKLTCRCGSRDHLPSEPVGKILSLKVSFLDILASWILNTNCLKLFQKQFFQTLTFLTYLHLELFNSGVFRHFSLHSEFPHDGTFQKVNATRDLEPFGLHQMLLEFNPKSTAKYYEVCVLPTTERKLKIICPVFQIRNKFKKLYFLDSSILKKPNLKDLTQVVEI